MKSHHYLTSGILESYLLGLVSNDEKQEVEHLVATDPDIRSQLDELELEIEQHFLRNAIPPPPTIKTAVLHRISKHEVRKHEPVDDHYGNRQRVETNPDRPTYIDVEVSNTYIRVHKYWRTTFIVIFILSKIFLILGLYFYFKSNSLEQEISRLKAATPQTSPLPGRTP